MTSLVLVTHGHLGRLLQDQVASILGREVSAQVVSVMPQADPEKVLTEIRSAVQNARDSGDVLLLTDLPGATPHNLADQVAGEHSLPLVSGLNLPMLLKAANYCDQPAPELAALAEKGGRQGITQR